jgi:hypothetical protein
VHRGEPLAALARPLCDCDSCDFCDRATTRWQRGRSRRSQKSQESQSQSMSSPGHGWPPSATLLANFNALASVRANPKPPPPVKNGALPAVSRPLPRGAACKLARAAGIAAASGTPYPAERKAVAPAAEGPLRAASVRKTYAPLLTFRSTPDPALKGLQSRLRFLQHSFSCARAAGAGPVSSGVRDGGPPRL